MKDKTDVRQGEGSRRTFIILAVGVTVLAVLVVVGFLYVYVMPDAEVAEPIAEQGAEDMGERRFGEPFAPRPEGDAADAPATPAN